MAERIITMRALLKKNLEDLGSKHDWSHITNQIGMFAYTGLTAEQMDKLAKEVSFSSIFSNLADCGSTLSTAPRMDVSLLRALRLVTLRDSLKRFTRLRDKAVLRIRCRITKMVPLDTWVI